MASEPSKPDVEESGPLVYEPAGDEFPVVKLPIDQLVPDAGNPRVHNDLNLEVIDGSLSRYGQQEALLVQESTRRVIAGNGRLEVLKKQGVEHVYCKLIDVDDETADQMSVWFNRSAETGSWDIERLRDRLASFTLRDFDPLRFDLPALETNLAPLDVPPQESEVEVDSPSSLDPRLFGGMTAMTRTSLPMRYWQSEGLIEGDVLDFGCGTEEHEGWERYDAFHAPDPAPLRQRYDTVLCSYVLNVQPSDHLITLVCCVLAKLCKPEGKALIAVRNDLKASQQSTRGVQVIKPPAEWQGLIGAFFDVHLVTSEGFLGFVGRLLPEAEGSSPSASRRRKARQ